MRKYTYRISVILVVIIILNMVGGCSGNDEKTPADPTPVLTGPAEPTSAAVEPDVQTGSEDGKNEIPGIGNESFGPLETDYKAHYGTQEVKEVVIYSENFDDGQTDFTGRGDANVRIVNDKVYQGKGSLFVSGRTSAWNGATVDLTELLKPNQTYIIKAYVMYDNGPDSVQIDCKVEKNDAQYLDFASAVVTKGEWTPITGSIFIIIDTFTADVYFETSYLGNDLIDFYVDEVEIIQETAMSDRGDIPALKDVYKDNFSVGAAATPYELNDKRKELAREQFNSLTPGNELKPDSLLDHDTSASDIKYDDNPAIRFDKAKPFLDFAEEAGIPVRGHTLIWHSQTPRWFFTEGYSTNANAPLVSGELMEKRMENYIRQVLLYTQTNYPGLIYAWDVVNEAINPGEGDENFLRSKDSLWYQVIGPEYIEKAFEYARKYADPEVKLFYNDYNTEDTARILGITRLVKELKEKGLIDGIGLQTHIKADSPSLIDIESSIRKYGELGLEIQITELDMDMQSNTEEAFMKQATRYKRLFTMLKNLDDKGAANITNVTFWGLSDDISWLNKPGKASFPLLFDKHLIQKPAFWGAVLSSDIPLY